MLLCPSHVAGTALSKSPEQELQQPPRATAHGAEVTWSGKEGSVSATQNKILVSSV